MSTPRSPEWRHWLAAGGLMVAATVLHAQPGPATTAAASAPVSAPVSATAVVTPDLQAARERIAAQRQRVMAEFEREERRCHEQFVVTPCIEAVRARRREALEVLGRELAVVDESLRQQRAADRLQRLAEKQRAQRAALAASAPAARVQQRRAPIEMIGSAPAASGVTATTRQPPSPSADPARRDRERRRERDAHRERVQEAQEHRDAVLERNARRAAEGREPAPALPLPAASDLRR